MKRIEHFYLACSEDLSYEENLRTSSFLENQIVATSRKIGCNTNEIATSADDDSVASPSSSSVKSFTPALGISPHKSSLLSQLCRS